MQEGANRVRGIERDRLSVDQPIVNKTATEKVAAKNVRRQNRSLQPEGQRRLAVGQAQPVFLNRDMLSARECEDQRQAEVAFVRITDTAAPRRLAEHQTAALLYLWRLLLS